MLNESSLILLGLSGLLTGGYLLSRNRRQQKQHAISQTRSENQNWAMELQMGPLGSLQDMEARLHDYGREVEARVDNKLLLLDALLQEVATERQRLEHLLQESRETRTLPPPASRAA